MKKRMFYFILMFTSFSLILMTNCKKKKDDIANTIPVLTTTAISAITSSSAASGGNISSDGNATVTTKGVCWSTSPNPTILDSITTINGTGTGIFTSSITGLAVSTTYYVRAYATNSVGTAYGNQVSFSTLPAGATTVPILTTTAITGIAPNSANGGGNISSDGNATVTSRGVCWSTSIYPTILDNKTSNGTGIGAFTSSITGLTESTIYYVRAYATNTEGTGYGNQLSFTTITSTPGTVTDFDGNVYHTITIGTQTWLKENLKVTHYRNGAPITKVTDNTAWGTLTTEAYCWYNNDSITNGLVYGALYNWYAVSDIRNICPVGWHVPTDAEWTTLTDSLGGLSVAGDALKEAGTTHWTAPNTGTNSSGFTGLPGGYRYSGGNFAVLTYYEDWWSSTQQNSINAYQRYISYSSASVTSSSTNLKVGNAVRLIKD